ncbi:MAG: hypothetical protein QOH35_2354, partial [Acidobacteriaceae bacterium]|nr:hypothetical protein [Acidobacteriaceae bacterium]
ETSVRALNERLRAGGERKWRFPESHLPRFPKVNGRNPYQELFVVVHHGEVRGGYIVTHSRFALRNEIVSVACGPQLNISEGLVNQYYSMVGVMQVQDILQRQPLSYGLGIGGLQTGQAKLLSAMGWTLFPVALSGRIISTSNFLANLEYLRHRPGFGFALELLRGSRLGTLGIRLAQARVPVSIRFVCSERVSEFGQWADTIWEQCRTKYSLVAVRDRDTLNRLYPPSDSRFIRLKISRSGDVLGWVVMLHSKLSDHRYFGNMHVGSIVDCLASPENAYPIVACATGFLQDRGVDMIVSNQASDAWCKALSAAGFLKLPSNFILGLSPKLTEKVAPLEQTRPGIHMNRGDGEGPTIVWQFGGQPLAW